MVRRSFITMFHNAAGVSSIEFALCTPFFILLLLGGVDMVRFIKANDRVEAISTTIASMIAENATGAVDSGTVQVNYVDVQFAHDAAMLVYPSLLRDAFRQGQEWSKTISISMAVVDFGPAQSGCSSNCIYVPKVVWSGGDKPRSCLEPPTAAGDTDPPSSTTLPTHIYGPGSSVVVDITYRFKPLIQSRFFNDVTIARSYYVAPRFGSIIKYTSISGDNGIARSCPGY